MGSELDISRYASIKPHSYKHTYTPYTATEDYRLQSHVASRQQYDEMYKRSIEDPEGFWGDIASQFHWESKWEEKHFDFNFDVRNGKIFTEWFRGGRTNIAYNCLDRNVAEGRGDQTAILWEGNDPGIDRKMTYKEVLEDVCRLANWLRSVGVKKGDAVSIYMPMVAELPIAMLACARIGAVHSVVFAGFSAESLAQRIDDCRCNVLLTCNAVMRGAKRIDLKKIADKALDICAKNGFQVSSLRYPASIFHSVGLEW